MLPTKVVRKQENSRMCLVCGLQNQFGLHAQFYELQDRQLFAKFTPCSHHQGYPGRLHGGMAAAILDEAIGRAVQSGRDDQMWGVTMSLTTRFRQPIPLEEEVRAVCRLTRETRRHFEGTGELYLGDGRVAIEASGKYLKVPLDQLGSFDPPLESWQVVVQEDDPETVQLPELPSRPS